MKNYANSCRNHAAVGGAALEDEAGEGCTGSIQPESSMPVAPPNTDAVPPPAAAGPEATARPAEARGAPPPSSLHGVRAPAAAAGSLTPLDPGSLFPLVQTADQILMHATSSGAPLEGLQAHTGAAAQRAIAALFRLWECAADIANIDCTRGMGLSMLTR